MRPLHLGSLLDFPFLDRLFPDSCASCEAALRTPKALLCEGCQAQCELQTIHHTLDGLPVLACSDYGGPVAAAIQRFKYRGHPELARRFARSWLERCALPTAGTLLPVPLHPLRLAERGYNQAALFALELSRRTRRPCAPRGLIRTVHTEKQSQLNRAARLSNLRGCFRTSRLTPQLQVLLVDDVVTTGATITACREALEASDVRLLGVLCIALKK